jgi:uncharacterized protein
LKVVDANILIYAVNTDAEHHERSVRWIDEALSGGATVGFAWVVLLAFLRLATKPNVFRRPLSLAEATAQVDSWLAQPAALLLEPTARHLEVMSELLRSVGSGGNLVNDAHLGALAIEHRGTVVSFDSDFGRFPGVSWEAPPPL